MPAFARSLSACRSLALLALAAATLAACATPQPRYSARTPDAGHAGMPSGAGGTYKVGKPYQVGGIWYVPREDKNYDVRGVASWYGDQFHMKRTANGEVFDKNALSAAHPTLPLPSIVEVTNLENGRSLRVRVNDRGPFVGGRVIDMSHAAARELGFDRQGLAKVRVRYVGPAPLGDYRIAAAPPPPASPPPAQPAPTAPATATVSVAQAPLPPVGADEARGEEGDVTWTAPAPAAVATAALEPLVSAPPPINPPDPQVARLAPSAPLGLIAPASGSGFRIQAGAFSQSANAERAVQTLNRAGAAAEIERVDRDGGSIYRVIVLASGDESAAFALRDQLAGYGFSDAQVIRPF